MLAYIVLLCKEGVVPSEHQAFSRLFRSEHSHRKFKCPLKVKFVS